MEGVPGEMSETQASSLVLRVLTCYSQFVNLGPGSDIAVQLFRTLLRLLVYAKGTAIAEVCFLDNLLVPLPMIFSSLTYSTLLLLSSLDLTLTFTKEATDFILRSVGQRPELLGLTVELVDAVCSVEGRETFAVELLSTLHESFLSRRVEDVLAHLRQYIQLLQR